MRAEDVAGLGPRRPRRASRRIVRTALSGMAGLGVLVVWVSTTFAQAPDGGYRVFRPDGAGPHPAVVFVSGCSGFAPAVAPKVYERVAETLRGQGYIVLFVDYVGRRGVRNCSRGPITEGDAAKDLVTAVTWLRSQPSVDRARISAVGWSYGGGAVLVALADHTEEQLGISRAVVYYPICRAVRPWTVAIPVLMLLAGDDEVAPSKACQAAVQKSATPDAVKTVTYHGALHAFDVSDLPAETHGAAGMMGHNPRAAAAAWHEVQQFLKSSQ
jgi:dienelactone hydrolase